MEPANFCFACPYHDSCDKDINDYIDWLINYTKPMEHHIKEDT